MIPCTEFDAERKDILDIRHFLRSYTLTYP